MTPWDDGPDVTAPIKPTGQAERERLAALADGIARASHAQLDSDDRRDLRRIAKLLRSPAESGHLATIRYCHDLLDAANVASTGDSNRPLEARLRDLLATPTGGAEPTIGYVTGEEVLPDGSRKLHVTTSRHWKEDVPIKLLDFATRPMVAPAPSGAPEGERDEEVRCTCQWASDASGEVDIWPAALDPHCRVHVGNGLEEKLGVPAGAWSPEELRAWLVERRKNEPTPRMGPNQEHYHAGWNDLLNAVLSRLEGAPSAADGEPT